MNEQQQVQEQQPEQIQQQTVTETQTAQPAVNWEAKAKELEAKLGQFSEYETVVTNIEKFLDADPESYESLKAWREGRKYERQPAQQKTQLKDQAPNLEQMREELRKEIEARDSVVLKTVSEMKAERTRQELRDKNPWLTDDLYKTFEERFEERVNREAKELMSSRGLLPKQARSEVISGYASYEPEALLFLTMKDEWLNAQSRRGPQTLPKGMQSKLGNNAGPTPGLMEQARKAYDEAAGDPDMATKVITDFAVQMGMTATELQKKLHAREED